MLPLSFRTMPSPISLMKPSFRTSPTPDLLQRLLLETSIGTYHRLLGVLFLRSIGLICKPLTSGDRSSSYLSITLSQSVALCFWKVLRSVSDDVRILVGSRTNGKAKMAPMAQH